MIVIEGKSRSGKKWVELNGSDHQYIKITSKRNCQVIIKAESVLTRRAIFVDVNGDKDFNVKFK